MSPQLNSTLFENRSRVAVLIDHAGEGDGRVKRAALAMRECGINVRVFALIREVDIPKFRHLEVLDGTDIPLTPIFLREQEIVPIPKWLIAVLRFFRHLLRPKKSIERDDHEGRTQETGYGEDRIARPALVARLNRTLGAIFWHRALWRVFQSEVNRFQPQLIHAHDLSTLGTGALLARRNGAALIYDSHEFELGRNGVELNTAERIRQSYERVYIKRVNTVISVSETIAERLKTIYQIEQPTVIPNITKAVPSNSSPLNKRQLGLNPDKPFVLYVGSLQRGRGLKMAIDAISGLSDVILAAAGNGPKRRRRELMEYAEQAGAMDRFKVLDPVPEDQVVDLLSLADVSIVPVQESCESYRLCLPNKLFQSLAAGTPVVSTPLPEVGAIIENINHCFVATDYSPQAFANALEHALEDPKNAVISLPKEIQPEQLLTRYKFLAEALILNKPIPAYPPLKHASKAIKAAARDRTQMRHRFPISLTVARVMAFMTSIEITIRRSN